MKEGKKIHIMDGIEIVQQEGMSDADVDLISSVAEREVNVRARLEARKKRLMVIVETDYLKGIRVQITDEMKQLGLEPQIIALALKIGSNQKLIAAHTADHEFNDSPSSDGLPW